MTEEVQCGVEGTMTDLFYLYIQHIVLLVSIFKILCSFQLAGNLMQLILHPQLMRCMLARQV